jgi:mutator protein MutT
VRNRAAVVVVAAAVVQHKDAFLVTRRPRGVHLEGVWEFPGGKCEPGETHETCLRREMEEELGVGVHVGQKVFEISHRYSDRTVELHFFDCKLIGEPVPRLGQEMHWVQREQLRTLEFPPADAELIRILQERVDST